MLGGQDAAIALLQACKSARASFTAITSELIDVALSGKTPSAAQAVTDLAIQWHDPRLWNIAVSACGADQNVDILGQARLVQAYDSFGFQAIIQAYVYLITSQYLPA